MSVAGGAAAGMRRRLVARVGRRGAAALLFGPDRVAVALVSEAQRRLDGGEPARARQILDALTRRPRPERVARQAAELWLRLGEPAAARDLCIGLLERSTGGRGQVLALLGRAQERDGRPAEAAAAYEEAIAADDGRATWHYRLGRVRAGAEQWEPAVTAYERAVELDGTHPGWLARLSEARAALGRSEAQVGAFADAARHLAQAVAHRPESTSWRFSLLDAAARAGDPGAVRAHLRPGLLAELTSARATRLVETLVRAGMWGEIRSLAEDPAPAAPSYQYCLGRIAERDGRLAEAAAAYEEAIAADDGQAAWHYRLGRVRESAGRWELAAVAYEWAVELDGSRALWRERLRRMRRKAPQWIFLSGDPDHARSLESIPDALQVGVVAPIRAEEPVTGWVPATDDTGVVQFILNGTVVAQTHPTRAVTFPGGLRYREFQRRIRDLWSYTGAGDVLEIAYGDRMLPIVDSGRRYLVADGESSAGDLLAKLADGYVFDKYGRIRKSIRIDIAWQDAIYELYSRLRHDLRDHLGLELFPFYGTMLGAVREQDFIGHDNDFDTVYVSGHSTPEAVRGEFTALCGFLLDKGYTLRVWKSHTWVIVPGTEQKLDIFFAWFDDDDYLQISYGHHGPPVRRSDDLFRFRTERLGRLEVPVPVNAEDVLAQLFGTGWREPDPGFSHRSSTRVIHDDYHLGPAELTDFHWRLFYRDSPPEGASSFATFVAPTLAENSTVLELGCGNGRDSLFFAENGHTVIAADRSAEAVEKARGARRPSAAGSLQVDQLDVSSREQLERFLSTRMPVAGHSVAVYLRFFLHAVDEETEDTLLDALVRVLPAGFRLCAEFRTTQDADLPKVHNDHYRRYIDEQMFTDKLRKRWDFEVEHLEAGRGLSPYRGEDPHLARILARRPAPAGSPAS